MKYLDLEFSLSGQKHVVKIARHSELEFCSKTYLNKWMRKYKRLITDNVKVINLYLPQVYSLYRQHYFQINNINVHYLNTYFRDINERFEFIFKSFSEGNKNVFTFSNIDYVLANLIDALSLLKEIGQKHKIIALKFNANAMLKVLIVIEEQYYIDKNSLNLNERYQNIIPLQKHDNDTSKTAS